VFSSPKRFWVFAALLLALNAAGLVWIRYSFVHIRKPLLRVVSVTPTNFLEGADRISVQFHEPIATPADTGKSPQQPLFALSPQPEGRWEWNSPDRLDYILAKKLPPGHTYQLKPAADVERRTGRTLFGTTEFRLQTSPLQLKTCKVQSVEKDAATVELRFNQPVSPSDLTKRTTIAAGETKLTFACLQSEPADTLSVRVQCGKEHFRIDINGELTGIGGELPLGKDLHESVTVPQRFVALRIDASPAALSDEATARIRFTRPLDRKQPTPKVELSPAVANTRTTLTEHEIVITGPLRCGSHYTITVPSDVLAVGGETLAGSQKLEFTLPDRDPTISMPFSSGILSPGGNLLLDVKAVNIQEVKILASRLHANNLIAHLRDSRSSDTSRELPERTVKLDWPRNEPKSAALDLRPIVNNQRGVYQVEVQSTHGRWIEAQATVTITDLAITCKRERAGLLAWVTSISNGKPVAGVRIAAMTRNNQTLADGQTDATGLIHLSIPTKSPDGPAWVVTAELADDLSFLKLGEDAALFDEVDQSGRATPTTYDVMLYTDRGVYRPGEQVHLTGIIRDAAGHTPPSFPLSVTVIRPDGRQIADLKTTPGGQGMFHVQFDAPEQGHTGRYRFRANLPGSADSLGDVHAWVEAFIPARIEIHAEPDRSRYGPGEKSNVNISGRYLFDQPAAGLELAVSGTHTRTPFITPAFPGYTFGSPAADREEAIAEIKGKLDDAGMHSLTIPAPKSAKLGLWKSTISSTVTEIGGRSVSTTTTTTFDTAGRHLGLRLPAHVVPVSTEISADWALVSTDGSSAAFAPIHFKLCRIEGDSSLEMIQGRPVWKWIELELAPTEWTIDSGDPSGKTAFKCADVGSYRLYATDDKGADARIDFYASDSGGGTTLGRPEKLDLILDHDRYHPGDTAKLAIRAPFAGSMLVTLETDRVLWQQIIETQSGSTELEVPLPADIRGGAFIAATVVRGVDTNNEKWLPTRAAGLAKVVTDHSDKSLPIEITAPKDLQPGNPAQVTVRIPAPEDPARPGVVHIWAVDDGILLAAAYHKPDPLNHFLAQRRLGVESEDLYRSLLPDNRRAASIDRIGGDGGDDEDKSMTRSPVPMKRRQPGVVWRTAVPVGSDGTVQITLPMPDITGRIRIMAVAVDGDRYGSAEQPVVLKAPLMAEASWPRFIAPGDRADVPVKLVNTTGADLKVTLATNITGPGKLSGQPDGEVSVPAQRSIVIWQTLTSTGEGQIAIHASATASSPDGTLTSPFDGDIPSRAASGVDTTIAVHKVHEGQPLTIQPDSNFLPDSTSVRVTIGPGPDIQLAPAIDSLIDYPYGCVEQTTSRLFALLEVPDLLATTNPERGKMVEDMIQGGIDRLWSMQTTSGGLSYWPGNSDSYLWGTAYAAEFLVRAHDSGRKIDPKFLTMLGDYLEKALRFKDETDDNLRAQICDVLARLNRPQPGWIASLAERQDRLDIAGRAHLAHALHAAGQHDRALALLKDEMLSIAVATTSSGRLTSSTTQIADLLWSLMDIDAAHPMLPVLAQKLNAARSNGEWHSTAENAAAVCALARYNRSSSKPGPFEGTLTTRSGQTPFESTSPHTSKILATDCPATIDLHGSGDAFITIATRGRTSKSLPAFSRGLEIKREWLARDGKPLELETIHVGDLIEVKVTLRALGAQREATNLAVVDLIPAGFEIENPAIATSADQHKINTLPDRTEFLDDRVVMFTSASTNAREFHYFLRAISAGEFTRAPIQAASMYDPGLAAGGGEATIIEVRR